MIRSEYWADRDGDLHYLIDSDTGNEINHEGLALDYLRRQFAGLMGEHQYEDGHLDELVWGELMDRWEEFRREEFDAMIDKHPLLWGGAAGHHNDHREPRRVLQRLYGWKILRPDAMESALLFPADQKALAKAFLQAVEEEGYYYDAYEDMPDEEIELIRVKLYDDEGRFYDTTLGELQNGTLKARPRGLHAIDDEERRAWAILQALERDNAPAFYAGKLGD